MDPITPFYPGSWARPQTFSMVDASVHDIKVSSKLFGRSCTLEPWKGTKTCHFKLLKKIKIQKYEPSKLVGSSLESILFWCDVTRAPKPQAAANQQNTSLSGSLETCNVTSSHKVVLLRNPELFNPWLSPPNFNQECIQREKDKRETKQTGKEKLWDAVWNEPNEDCKRASG